MISRGRADRWLVALTVVWAIVVSAGMTALWRYKMTAGPVSSAPVDWPKESAIARRSDGATLVMLAHPKCSCTRASIAELAALMASGHEQLTAHVLFVRPPGVPEGWEKTDTWESASRIPGVVVHADEGGAEARRFGAVVSGHAVVYDREGHLLFQGGITKARGHAGANLGRDRVLALVTGGAADRHDSPTFGCDLSNEEAKQ